MVRRYWMIVEGNERDGYSAFFPDLPGCVSGGDTIEQCIAQAREAAAFHLEGLAADGEPLPDAMAADDLHIDNGIELAVRSYYDVA